MSMNKVKLSQIVRDFIVTLDGDDFASNASDIAIRNFALRGIREIGFDLGKKIKSEKLTIDTTNDTVSLPDDYVDLSKLGAVDEDGIIRPLVMNDNINYSKKDKDGTGKGDSDAGPLNIPANLVEDKEASKTATGSTPSRPDDSFVFDNYTFSGGTGRLYGFGGAQSAGHFRINLDDNRIEVELHTNATEVVMEYVADEARSTDPEVHVYAEEALRCYMYYKIIERKSSVPANEKARARAEYYNERRKANARISHFTKDEVLKTIRKNYMQAPKF
tara:strand:+ start:3503 stop:4327 length:825 start_codon:yes stop_codon:yes gene_type:complete